MNTVGEILRHLRSGGTVVVESDELAELLRDALARMCGEAIWIDVARFLDVGSDCFAKMFDLARTLWEIYDPSSNRTIVVYFPRKLLEMYRPSNVREAVFVYADRKPPRIGTVIHREIYDLLDVATVSRLLPATRFYTVKNLHG